jgi:hypothetical protein
MVSTRPGKCNRGGIDHLCSIATPEKGQEDNKQVEHDIVLWQVCPEGNLQLVRLRMMAVEC